MFNVEKVTNDCIQWIRDWREENGPGCNFIVGISGGVDSLVAAELCVEAIGADKVLGVIMPNREQDDIDVALEKAQETINHKHALDKEFRSCESQIKEALGVDVYIIPKDDFDKRVYKTLSKDDISFVGRTKDIATGKIRTTVGFKDGTQTSVVLNNWEDEDDTEKAIMWCLLKKCFKSKRSLEKVIYSMEDM